ncbi:MAG: MBL fold metallo-hydrolase [Lachnospiraceae bacterium]|nr:MBL fold metallo-hydrolase [Lachnospiraceae bacterium]
MKLTFVGADHQVTGSCHYLQACGKHILVDCGMQQGVNPFACCEIPVGEALIDYVFLTHAHVDHSGNLPLLYAKGFRGQVFTTEASADLCSIMLRDCAHIQMQEAEWKNRKAKRHSGLQAVEPAYTMEDADGIIKRIVPCEYNKVIEISEGISIRFTDVGHLLGSASIEVWLTEGEASKKLVFSGDIGNKNQPLIKDPIYTDEADYVIMESTYGDRYHAGERPEYVSNLAEIINKTFRRGGNVVIPSFAVGRTQEMLYFLRKIKEDKLVPDFPGFEVYVDSPLAVEATGVFQKNIYTCFDDEAMELVRKGINPLNFQGLKLAITSEESKQINFDEKPKVIISASGMCEAGRIRHHLKHNLWRLECTVLFVGYQAAGTLGRSLIEGVDEVKLFGEAVEVRADIRQLPGLSGHADKNGLLEWVNAFAKKPDWVFVVHGEDTTCNLFADCLKNEYGHKAYAPYSGTRVDLITGAIEYEAAPVAVKKRAHAASDVFARLLAAGQRLIAVIYRNEGSANKDLARFADQINSLADKWDV